MKAKAEFVHHRLYCASPSIYYFYSCISCHVEQTLFWFSEIFLKLWDSICFVRKVMVFRFYSLFLWFVFFFFNSNSFGFWLLGIYVLSSNSLFFSSFSFLPSLFFFKFPKELKIEWENIIPMALWSWIFFCIKTFWNKDQITLVFVKLFFKFKNIRNLTGINFSLFQKADLEIYFLFFIPNPLWLYCHKLSFIVLLFCFFKPFFHFDKDFVCIFSAFYETWIALSFSEEK